MMKKRNLTYLIIGNGNLAKHLKFYFKLKKINYIEWFRSKHSILTLKEKCKLADFVLLAISDDAISEFIVRYLPTISNKKIIHFSGTLNTPYALGFHPLMTFGPQLEVKDFYEKILFTTSQNPSQFKNIFPSLKNLCRKIESHDRPYYHALCVLLGSGSQVLWRECKSELKSLGIPGKTINFYIEQNLKNFILNENESFTGPWKRNDLKTIKQNRVSLAKGKFYKTYINLKNIYSGNNKNEINP